MKDTEAEVIQDIARRQQLGLLKYGTTVAQNPLSDREWRQHAYEECLDMAIYLKRSIQETGQAPSIEDLEQENRLLRARNERLEKEMAEAVAVEREACAKVCEDAISSIWEFHPEYVNQVGRNVCTNLAAAIRARGAA